MMNASDIRRSSELVPEDLRLFYFEVAEDLMGQADFRPFMQIAISILIQVLCHCIPLVRAKIFAEELAAFVMVRVVDKSTPIDPGTPTWRYVLGTPREFPKIIGEFTSVFVERYPHLMVLRNPGDG